MRKGRRDGPEKEGRVKEGARGGTERAEISNQA